MAKIKVPKIDIINKTNEEIFTFKNRDKIGLRISVNLCATIK